MSTDLAADVPATRPRAFRWSAAAVILGLAIAAQVVFLIRFADDPTFSKMSVLWVWPAALFALTLWWIFGSGLTWTTRFTGLAAVAAAAIVFFAVYRVDGVDGDMVPRLAYRWEPERAELAREFWKSRAKAAPAESPTTAAETTAATAEPLIAGPDDWADFRGPQRDGIVRGSGFRTNWTEKPPQELWRHPVGLGWSSFSVLGDYAITMEQRDEQESVVCYRLTTGEQLWVHEDAARFRTVEVNGGDGPHATPVIAGDQTFSLGGTGILNCLETRTGKKLWSRDILSDAGKDGTPVKNLEWGVSGSPLVIDDYVITLPGEGDGRSVIAYRRSSGEIAWTSGTFPAGYGGPRMEEIGGVRQLLAFHGLGIAGLALDTGRLLWNFPMQNMPKVNSAQPVKLDDSSLLVGTGYGVGSVRLKLTAAEDQWKPQEVWKTNRLKLKFNDVVLVDDCVYGLDDGVLTCIETATGKTKWKARGFGYGQLLAFLKTLLVVTEEGDVVLVAADPAGFEELGRIHAVDGTTWNHPAVAQGKLLVRNGTAAVCYDVAP